VRVTPELIIFLKRSEVMTNFLKKEGYELEINEFSLILDPFWKKNLTHDTVKERFINGHICTNKFGADYFYPTNFVFSHDEKEIEKLEKTMQKHGVNTDDFLLVQGWCLGGIGFFDDEIGNCFRKPVESFWSCVDSTIQDAEKYFIEKGWKVFFKEEENIVPKEEKTTALVLNYFREYKHHIPEIAKLANLSIDELKEEIEENLEYLIEKGLIIIKNRS
jgi:hypothetical protein